jgi:hypothetical protein
MKVDEVLDQVFFLLNSEIEINGCLVKIANNIYIAPDEDSYRDMYKSVLIEDSNFSKKLSSSYVSVWGGGDVVYCSPIKIKGKLCTSINQQFPIALTEINSAVVIEDNEVIKVV